MDDLLRDLRHAVRELVRRPAFAGAAIVTLALGIGANVLVFTLVDGVLLEPLPYRDSERLVEVWNSWENEPRALLAVPEARVYGESRSLAALAAFAPASFDLTADGDAERVSGAYAGAEIFAVLGVEPMLGRGFGAADDGAGAPPVAVLGWELWTRRFGADPAVLGRTIRVDGSEVTVVGVLPAGVRLPADHRTGGRTELWIPLGPFVPPELVEHWGMHFLQAAARLREGTTLAQAQAEIDLRVRRLAASGTVPPGDAVTNDGFRALLRPVHEEVTGSARRSLTLLLGAVAMVLAIACANVANLELARGRGRRREAALRSALGATRLRLARVFLAESSVLAVAGGAAGLGLAAAGLQLVQAAAPSGIPRLAEVELDAGVYAFALAVTAGAAIGFGLLPALRGSRTELAPGLRGGGADELSEARWRRPLIALEVALAVVLVVGAGLLARTLWNLDRVDTGMAIESVLTVAIDPPGTAYEDGPALDDLFRRVRREVDALPGAVAAGAVSHLPLGSRRGDWNFYPEGRAIGPDDPKPRGDWQVVTPGYFEAVGIGLVAGRLLADGDDPAAPLVLLVNDSLARRYWPGGSPVGSRVRLGGSDDNPLATIVGVVADARSAAVGEEAVPELYLPRAQAAAIMGRTPPRQLTLAVQTAGDPAREREAVRAAVLRVDRELALTGPRTLAEVRSQSLSLTRFATGALGGFAALALVLGVVGIYGVVSYLTAARRREIGIRLALGATRQGIVALVLGQGMRPVLAGILIGGVAALGATRALGALLYGIEPADPLTYVAVAGLFVLVAALACWSPARQAASVDPSIVLRQD